MAASINGGGNFVGKAYIDVGQNTLYLQKFCVYNKNGNLYWNQYMANLFAAKSEASILLKNYQITGAQQTKNFECINSLFGIGELSASLIIAELKDITRFNNIKQINASCGLDPTIVQSGKSINYHGPISKRGNRYARKILFNCSRNIVTLSAKCDKENPIYVYYQKKKQEGKHYYACLTACSTKLIRIIYALCMNNSTSQN